MGKGDVELVFPLMCPVDDIHFHIEQRILSHGLTDAGPKAASSLRDGIIARRL
jgi:hypothetical protein